MVAYASGMFGWAKVGSDPLKVVKDTGSVLSLAQRILEVFVCQKCRPSRGSGETANPLEFFTFFLGCKCG